MKRILRPLCGAAMLLASLMTGSAMADGWRANLVCDVDGSGIFTDLGGRTPFAAILNRGELYVSSIHGLPPERSFTCQIDCIDQGPLNVRAPCGVTDASGTLSAQRIRGFLPPGVCATIDFFLFDGAGPFSSSTLCVEGVVIPQ